MACISIPQLPIPQLPDGFTITPPPLPSIPGLPNLCCKLPPIPIPDIPISIPGAGIVINAAVITALNIAVTSILTYINALSLPCPVE